MVVIGEGLEDGIERVQYGVCLYRTDPAALPGKHEGVKVFNASLLTRELKVVESAKSLRCRGNAFERIFKKCPRD